MSIIGLVRRALPALLILFAMACANPSSGGGGGAITFPETIAALEGTWFREVERVDENDEGPEDDDVFQYAETWIIDAANGTWERHQERTGSDDPEFDGLDRTRGTITYRASDGVVAFVETDSWDDDLDAWVASEDDEDPLTYRNLIINGQWIQDAMIRIGSGSGRVGTWETTSRRLDTNDDDVDDTGYKQRYVLTASTIKVDTYLLDSSGKITDDPYFTGTPAAYTADADTVTVGGQAYAYKVVAKKYLEFGLTIDGGVRSFTKQ